MTKSQKLAFTRAICIMQEGLAQYAEAHQDVYGTPIAQDGVLGEAWITMTRELCSTIVGCGELGTLDGATIDRKIRAMAQDHGFTADFECE